MIENNALIDLSNYKILSIIGNGELSQVLKVQEISTGDVYIAKVSHQELDKSIDKQLLLQELNYMIQLNHPSVIKFYGYSQYDFDQENHMVTLMENISNGTLYQQISNKKNKSSPQIFDDTKKLINIYGIASAMSYLHSKNILHRDLNPNNILEDSNYYPKVTNFGFSQLYVKNINQTMRLNGTQFFSAPEIIEKDLYLKSSDVYSFAITVYFILTGSFLFDIFSTFEKRKKIELPTSIPESYSKLINDCLSFDPSSRPSFDEIIHRLKEDDGFIIESINKEEYLAYIHYIESNDKEKTTEIETEKIEEVETKAFLLNVETLNLSEFKKKEKIGGGSYSDVYKIIKKETNDFFAAKILKDIMNENSINSQNGLCLSREVNILSKYQHTFILKFVGYSPINFNNVMKPVIVTEYLRNNSLEKILEIERSGIQIPFWNETTKLIIIYGIAFSMAYLHSQNILHRDLKPDNILIDDFLFPKISDFGFSMKISENKDDYEPYAIGTLAFISPEIFTEYKYTKAADVYAFAMILFEILSLEFPFGELNCAQICYKVSNKKERPNFNKKVNQRFKKLIKSCWQHDYTKRPSFDAIVEYLKTDHEFITKNVDEKLYFEFIEFTEQQNNKSQQTKNFSFKKHFLDFTYKEYNDLLQYSSSVNIDDYETLDLISQGDFSSTFEVVEKSTGKIYSAEISNINISKLTQKEIKNISEEVNILSNTKHPSIQQLYGYSVFNFKHHLKPVIISERFIKKRTLFDILEKQRNGEIDLKWNDNKKFIVIYGIASGMTYLHSHEIIHRNLNPKNIIIDENYHPKITEIGFHSQIQNSHFVTSRSKKGFNEIPFYLAPEILKEECIGKQCDVYSFSLIVYEILTNEVPYSNIKSVKQLFAEVVNKNYRPPFNKQISKECWKFINECWSDNASKRPTFEKIVSILEEYPNFMSKSIDKNELLKFISQEKLLSC